MALSYPSPDHVRPCRTCGAPIVILRRPPKRDTAPKWGAFVVHDPLPLAHPAPAYFGQEPHLVDYHTKYTLILGNRAKDIPVAIPHLCTTE